MAGTKNDVLVAKNADYSQAAAPNPQSSENNGLISNGQMWIGSTALNVGGTHINVGSITSPLGTLNIGYSSPNITLDLSGGKPLTWSTVSTNTSMAVNRGYICISPGGALTMSLPATSAVGDELAVTLDGATSFTITQAAGQSIRFGNATTTAGVGGSIASTQQGDTVTLVCSVANLKWNVISSMGNPTIV